MKDSLPILCGLRISVNSYKQQAIFRIENYVSCYLKVSLPFKVVFFYDYYFLTHLTSEATMRYTRKWTISRSNLTRNPRSSLVQNHRLSWKNFLVRELCEVLDLDAEDVDTDSSIFSMGVTSFDLIRIKQNLEKQLSDAKDVPMVALLPNPTFKALAESIEISDRRMEYSPVVEMQH